MEAFCSAGCMRRMVMRTKSWSRVKKEIEFLCGVWALVGRIAGRKSRIPWHAISVNLIRKVHHSPPCHRSKGLIRESYKLCESLR